MKIFLFLFLIVPSLAGAQIITTVAGNNKIGYTGDNGSATLAELNKPSDLCADATGNIYFTDQLYFKRHSLVHFPCRRIGTLG
jgi:hypothetical protein